MRILVLVMALLTTRALARVNIKCRAQEELCSGKLPSMTPLKALPSYYKADDIEVRGQGLGLSGVAGVDLPKTL